MSGSASEDIVIVDSSDYAQVIFEDVKETYTIAKPLECVFTLNELLRSDGADEWIGIYKVGFTTCAEFVCKLSVEMVNESKGKLTFSIEDLPKEDGEFYQFVYVSNGKQIRGASVPFQFKIDECTEYSDDENDAVVVKFENNDTYHDIKTRCIKLASSNETYEKVVRDNEGVIKTLKDEVASIKLRCFRLTMDNEKLNFTLNNKADNLRNLAESLTNITSDNDNLQNQLNDFSNENKNLKDQLQERLDQVDSLKADFETTKIDQIQKLEAQVVQRTEELNKVKLDLNNNNVNVNEQTETIKFMIEDREKMSQLIEDLINNKNDSKSLQEDTLQEINMTKEKLNASEQCKEMLRAQLEMSQSELGEIKQKMSVEYNQLADKLAQTQFDQTAYGKKIDQIKDKHTEEINQLNGTMFVLRSAHTHLENRLKTSEQRKESAEKENEANKKLIEKKNPENEELKERIRYGAIEYAKLHEKYRLLKNQKFNIEMNLTNQQDNENQLIRRRTHTNSVQNDSATQEPEKTVSQSARASAADSENTLLDAFLGSSFYNGGWNENSPRDQSNLPSDKKQISHLKDLTASKTPATTTQPKSSQSSDFSSDDGLVHANRKNIENEQNLSEKIRNCQIGQTEPCELSKNNENCEVCGFVFPTDVNKSGREEHYTNHFGPSCPVCFLQFHKGYSQKDFEMHVNSHFTN